jgi:16S rRNA (uracil1498-N3)-methyltransferase
LRVFHPPSSALAPGARIELDADETRYLVRVRRARPGAALELLDGAGGRWHAQAVAIGPRTATLELGAPVPAPSIRSRVALLLALPRPTALGEAIAAACAGGAHGLHLVVTERSGAAVPSPARIERIVRAAMRQSGRPDPLRVHPPVDLTTALALDADLPGLVALPGAPGAALASASALRVLVGPEGGLSDDEERRAATAGLVPLGLGPWTLRSESAVTAALARILG